MTDSRGGDPDDSAAHQQHIRARLRDDPGPAHELRRLLHGELVTPDSNARGHDPIIVCGRRSGLAPRVQALPWPGC